MRVLLKHLALFAGVFLFLSSCDYFCDCEEETTPCMFAYEQLIYTQGVDDDPAPQFEGMETTPDGIFSAYDNGSGRTLVIDSLSGIIDVNASDAGEYTVEFTLDDGKTTCESQVAIEEGEPETEECELRYSEKEEALFFPNESKSLLIRPLGEFSDPTKVEGRFTVWPQGLDIDPATGVIDVNTSEPGLTYYVTFTSENGRISCTTKVAVGGLDYRDALLDFDGAVDGEFLEENPSVREFVVVDSIASPLFNFEQDGTLGLEFSSPDEDLVFVRDNEAPASINVRATLRNIDQSENIESGFFREFTLEYQYDSPEGRITGEAEIVIYYYRTVGEIPSSLLDLIGRKERVPGTNDGRLMHRHGIMCGGGALR